jgi:hypothetical protein
MTSSQSGVPSRDVNGYLIDPIRGEEVDRALALRSRFLA